MNLHPDYLIDDARAERQVRLRYLQRRLAHRLLYPAILLLFAGVIFSLLAVLR